VDCSLPGSSVHGISQARILDWVAVSSPGDLSNPGLELTSPELTGDSLPLNHQGSPIYTGDRQYSKTIITVFILPEC